MSRLVNIGNVSIKAQTNPTISNTIAASAMAMTYVYQDAPVAPAAAGPGRRPAPRPAAPTGGRR